MEQSNNQLPLSLTADLTPEQRALLMLWLKKQQDARDPESRAPKIQLPLVGIHMSDTRPPFFCVHSFGGGTFYYVALSRFMSDTQAVYALQARGLIDSEEPQTSIETMAAHYITAIRRVQPTGPYLLGGWCFGGIIAFEMAQQLHMQGQTTALLALLDASPAPLAIPDDTPSVILNFLGMASTALGEWPEIEPTYLCSLSEDEQIELLRNALKQFRRDQLRRINLDPEVQPQALRRVLSIFKSNAKALRAYTPQRYPGRITFFKPREQYPDSPPQAYETFWSDYTAEPIEVYNVAGHHMSILQEPFVQNLAQQLQHCIDRTVATLDRETDRSLAGGK